MLGRNATQPQGAEARFGALQRDHAGLDIGDVLRADFSDLIGLAGSVLGGRR